MATTASQDQSFTLFPNFPTEIRLRIWSCAANACPRTIDVWTDFKRCEVDNTIFFCQVYLVELARLPPPFLLSTCRESREEALKRYTPEFQTSMDLMNGIKVSMPAKWYVNWKIDLFVPRGYWNIISFADFVSRGLDNGLNRIAIDVTGTFWRQNLRDYIRDKNCWVLNGVHEVVLYDPTEDAMWKGGDYLEKFRRRHKDGPRDLSFEPVGEPEQTVRDVEIFLNKCWDKIEGQVVEEEEEVVVAKSYLDDTSPTAAEYLLRPDVKLMKLIARKPEKIPILEQGY